MLKVRYGKAKIVRTKSGKRVRKRRVRAQANDAESMLDLFSGIAQAQAKRPRRASKARTMQEWANLWDISPRTIHRYIEKGGLLKSENTPYASYSFYLDSPEIKRRKYREK